MAQIQLVIFDFDGTLVDTAPDLIRATNFYLEHKGFDKMSEQRIRENIGMGLRNLIQGVWPDDQVKDPEFTRKIEGEFLAIYEREYLTSPQLFPNAYEFLTEWEGSIAIVSNKRARFIHPILEKLGIHKLPWARVIGGDTYPQMKPHPVPFYGAMDAAGVTPEETLIVGDGLPDIEGALAIGSRSVAVDFGYHPVDELIELGATTSIADFADLIPLIETLK